MNSGLVDFSDGIADLVDSISLSVIRVNGRGHSSGYAVRPGYAVTSALAVPRGDRTGVSVQYPDGSEGQARVEGVDRRYDLALLSLPKGLPVPAFSEAPRTGSTVFAIGRPGRVIRAAFGIVSARTERFSLPSGPELSPYIEVDGSLPDGFGGGPLMDARGAVVGMNSPYPRGSGMTVPSTLLDGLVSAILEGKTPVQAYLGVNTMPVPNPDGDGTLLLVVEVEKGSPADSGGIRLGDVILGIGGKNVASPSDLAGILASVPPEGPIALDLLRAGEPLRLSLEPGRC